IGAGGNITFRTLDPWGPTLETSTRLEAQAMNSTDGLSLWRNVELGMRLKLANFWYLWSALHYRPAHFDDREVGDGAALERDSSFGHELTLATDPRARV